jgi:HAD superfamily hydrolase (TIGR01549 family)
MKISAMRRALKRSFFPSDMLEDAVIAFKNNFGKSRFFHSQYFVETLLGKEGEESTDLQELILNYYSQAVEDEYLQVDVTQGIIELLDSLKNKALYIASGSEQQQLIRVFKKRQLDIYFNAIVGSPETKSINVKNIINKHPKDKILFVGDAMADYTAAQDNQIDFIFYSPYSNVKEKMLEMSKLHKFPVLNSFS